MSGRVLNILLVEDNPDHAELVRRSLERLPVASALQQVEDGESALDYLFGAGACADRARFPVPDLVLLDLRLPRLTGLEVLQRVKRHPTLGRTPVVVLTTSDAERDVAAAHEYHANSYVTKPVDFQRLAQIIQELGFGPPADKQQPQPENDNP